MDNDSGHTSRLTRDWIASNVPKKIPWPSQSLDLNPIENLFSWVKQKLTKKGPKSIKELKSILKEIWGLEPEFLKPFGSQCHTVAKW